MYIAPLSISERGAILFLSEKSLRMRLSRNLLWITILSTTFPVLFYGYSLVVVFSSAFFFCEKKKQKTLHKRNCRKFPLLVPQECVHSVGYLLVIAAYGCFKGAADRPQLATLRASN